MKIRLMKKWSYVFLFAILFFFLGYIRDEFFVQSNYWLGYLLKPDTEYVKGLKYHFFFSRLSYDSLYYTKYIATFVFTLLYWVLSVSCVSKILSSNNYFWMITKLYFGLFLASLCIFFSGFIVFDIYKTYSFARFIAGILQSPILCVLLLLSTTIPKNNV